MGRADFFASGLRNYLFAQHIAMYFLSVVIYTPTTATVCFVASVWNSFVSFAASTAQKPARRWPMTCAPPSAPCTSNRARSGRTTRPTRLAPTPRGTQRAATLRRCRAQFYPSQFVTRPLFAFKPGCADARCGGSLRCGGGPSAGWRRWRVGRRGALYGLRSAAKRALRDAPRRSVYLAYK